MDTVKYFIIVVLGILAVVVSWYSLIVVGLVLVAFLAAKLITSFKKAWNGTTTG